MIPALDFSNINTLKTFKVFQVDKLQELSSLHQIFCLAWVWIYMDKLVFLAM